MISNATVCTYAKTLDIILKSCPKNTVTKFTLYSISFIKTSLRVDSDSKWLAIMKIALWFLVSCSYNSYKNCN